MQLTFSMPYTITPLNAHHFFGYYGVSPWSADGKWFLCLESTFQNRMPEKGEKAKILLLNRENGRIRTLTTTQAWNFQQGAMLNWLPSHPNSHIILNDVSPNTQKLVSKIVDINAESDSNVVRWLPRPVSAVGHAHDWALCLNFDRFREERMVISYPFEYPYPDDRPHSPNDGVFWMDLKSGETRLLISYDQLWSLHPLTAGLAEKEGITDENDFPPMRVEHVVFSPSDNRFLMLARYALGFKTFNTSMWTMNTDGSDGASPYLAVNYNEGLSHFEWMDETHLIVTIDVKDENTAKPIKAIKRHVRMTDKIGTRELIAPNNLRQDGHPSMHPSGKGFATDTYVIQGKRYLYYVDLETQNVTTIASFENPPEITGNWRCDPHPRWNRTGTQLAFDGLGENGRQVYVVDVKKNQ